MDPSARLAGAVVLLSSWAAVMSLDVGMMYGLGSKTWQRQHKLKHDFVLASAESSTTATTHFFEGALLNHFGNRHATWRQRFHVDSTFWDCDGCPVFLYVGGEATLSPPSDKLFMYELAREHRALMIGLEHRYYGESFPVANMSQAGLEYLTSSQALADVMWFISWINSGSTSLVQANPKLILPRSTAASPWIAFGGSYPGNLAAWLKIKYPHLLRGSVSSSAPVNAEYNYEQYAQVVGSALADVNIGGSPECYSKVQKAAEQLRRLVTATAPYGVSDRIPGPLRPCSPMDGDMDLTAYEAELFGNFQGTVQYNEEMADSPTVRDLCKIMTSGNEPLSGFASIADLFHKQSSSSCVSSSFQDDVIRPLSNASFSGHGCASSKGGCSMERQWIYQSCNEFGFFQTTSGDSHPFQAFSSLTVQNAGAAICKEAFGIVSHPWAKWSNAAYGGRAVEGINITFVNGSMDPWHALGVINSTSPFFNSCTDECSRQELSETESVVFLKDTPHCRDMKASSPSEPESVSWAHSIIRANVAKWIGSGLDSSQDYDTLYQ